MEDRLLDARGREDCEGELVSGFVEVDERGRSADGRGVDASEYARDFRLAGGKKPRALRGMRPICVGALSFGRSTQESCFQSGSDSAFEKTELLSASLCLGMLQPLGSPCVSVVGVLLLLESSPYSPSSRSSAGSASGACTRVPLTPQASTGNKISFFICTLSFGHMRFALRSIACWQLYLILSPASVSCGLTLWMYTSASRSSFSPGGAEILIRSSEFLRFMRPTESGTRCSFAVKRSLRFIALTMASLSSCVPSPTCEPAPAGPHCFGGGALTDVRRPCVDRRFRVLPESLDVVSLAKTVAAMPWTADQEFPHSFDIVAEGDFTFCAPKER